MAKESNLVKDRLGQNAEAFQDALMEAHEGLTLEQCVRMDVRLILILAGQIGDIDILKKALVAARSGAK